MITVTEVRCGCLVIPHLSIQPGKIAFIGPNGSGKTTFLEMIAGIRLPDSGTVMISGKKPREAATGWVCEFPDLNMAFSRTRDEIASPLRFSGVPCKEIDERVEETAKRLGIPHLLDRLIRTLSGGEKVLVATAAALINRPEILILDETDAHLDADTFQAVDRILSGWNLKWILFASHREDHIATADYVIRLEKGEVRQGPVSPVETQKGSVLCDPALWRRIYAPGP